MQILPDTNIFFLIVFFNFTVDMPFCFKFMFYKIDRPIFSKQNLKIWKIKVFVLSQVNEFLSKHHIHKKNLRSNKMRLEQAFEEVIYIVSLDIYSVFSESFWVRVGCWILLYFQICTIMCLFLTSIYTDLVYILGKGEGLE